MRECKGYTAEEYREVLKAIYDMNAEKRKKVFGASVLIDVYIEDFSASELIEKYRAYVNTPKVGEYWKRKDNNGMVVVRHVEKDVVYVYLCDGGYSNCYSFKHFVGNFIRTEHKSKHLESLIKEMKEMSSVEWN